MSKLITIQARVRKEKGKGYARRLRATGWIPGNLIGVTEGPLMLEIEEKDLSKAWQNGRRFSLHLDGDMKSVKIHELQLNAPKRRAIHVDLMPDADSVSG